jgi:hypothetical protein
MDGRAHREGLLAALHESLELGDLDSVKRAADSLHKVGGDPVAALSSMVLNELPDCDQRTLALRTLEHLDSTVARSIAERLHASPGYVEAREVRSGMLSARTTAPQRDPSKWWIFGPLIALAILWPAYSIYRFNHPKPAEPPKPLSPWTDQEVEMEARTACREAVRQRLRDPDSADFPFPSPSEVQISYSGEVKVQGYLHANNGLGLKVRADYLCALQADRQARALSVLNAQLVQR